MSTREFPHPAARTEEPPPPGAAASDLPALRARHVALLRRWDGDAAQRDRAAADELRAAVARAGAWIDSPADRDAAQGIIDYWTSAISSLPGEAFPSLLQLARFRPENKTAWIARADATVQAMKEVGLGKTARIVILGLLAEGRALLDEEHAALRLPHADEVRAQLAAAGLLGSIDRDGRQTFWLAHEDLLRDWPQLDLWLASLTSRNAKFDKAMAELRNWEFRDRKWAYLLHGQALRDARRFRGRDPALDAYVARSNLAQGMTIAIVAGLVLLCVLVAFRSGDDSGQSSGAADYQAELVNEVVALQPEKVAPPDAAALADAPVDGYVWAGSAGLPLLRDAAGDSIDPGTIVAGGRYHTRVDIALRAGLPDRDSYQSAARVGVIPAGALVEVIDRPAEFPRNTGVQFWVHVRRVTTVFVQYAGGAAEQAKARTLVTALRDRGYNVGEVPENRAEAAGSYRINFPHVADLDLAQRLAGTLGLIAPPGRGMRPRCAMLQTTKRNAPGVLEVWIDLTGIDLRTAASRVPEQRIACDQPPEATDIGMTDAMN